MPPFSIFSSEMSILSKAINGGHTLVSILYVFGLVIAFCAISNILIKMCFGNTENTSPKVNKDFRESLPSVSSICCS
jgi:formate hydrogenlyase subunit 3/multisubunit Na+/H+ antiporter MnhD subunit